MPISDFSIYLTLDPVSTAPITVFRERFPFGLSPSRWLGISLFYAVPYRHPEYCGEKLPEFAAQESHFPVEIGPPYTMYRNGTFNIRLGLPFPALRNLRMRPSASLQAVIDYMTRNPVWDPADPRYNNVRLFKPNVAISHSIPGESGKLDAGPGGHIMRELELEYARGIGPARAVGLAIWEQPYKRERAYKLAALSNDGIEFSFQGSK